MTDEGKIIFEQKSKWKEEKPLLGSALILYPFMLFFAFAIGFLSNDVNFFDCHNAPFKFKSSLQYPIDLTTGAVVGLIVSFILQKGGGKSRWSKNLLMEMKSLLGHLNKRESFLLAILSALSEEVFFRGFLMNKIGILWSTLIFGLAHFPRNRTFLLWTIEATAMGFLFGYLFYYSGNLIAPATAHFIINLSSLKYIREMNQHSDSITDHLN